MRAACSPPLSSLHAQAPQALPRHIERTPSFFVPEPEPKQAILCEKLKAHTSAITAALVLCDTGQQLCLLLSCQ